MLKIAELLIGPITGLLDKVIPDKDAREKMAHEIATMAERHAHEVTKLQIELNKQEAAHKSIFVAGWRPGAGWVCVVGMAMNFLITPLANLALTALQIVDVDGNLVVVPMIDLTVMMPVLLGMLGLGTLRTYEKRNGVSREK